MTASPEGVRERGRDRSADAKHRIGVLDLGSTSFNLLVIDATGAGELERVERRREMLRLGATLGSGDAIPEEVCASAVQVAAALRERAEALGVDRILPLATAALRDASNGVALAQRISEVVGTPVRLLSGEQEARIIFGAFAHRLPLGEEISLGIDLGGGSCELATGNRWDVTWETTLRVGVARLHRAHVTTDPLSRGERKAIRREVQAALARHRAVVLSQGATQCVASGGTIRALARVVGAERRSKARGLHVTASELEALADRLCAADHDERLAMPGMKRSRADLLPTGAVILETLAEQLEVDEIIVCDWGLREGAVLQSLGLLDAI